MVNYQLHIMARATLTHWVLQQGGADDCIQVDDKVKPSGRWQQCRVHPESWIGLSFVDLCPNDSDPWTSPNLVAVTGALMDEYEVAKLWLQLICSICTIPLTPDPDVPGKKEYVSHPENLCLGRRQRRAGRRQDGLVDAKDGLVDAKTGWSTPKTGWSTKEE
ncbi:hypothetical protein E6O75_ATG05422 [Venturia nashicola]|uniref:Uncharacterized protein n=1 Tax=Venturia nashicola TaxID=86259 RepID=A0A4Z1P0C4_9PEZI|nr:hypothetical protein E6O75_ATG05422 [Venturia nashicola]